MSIVELIDDYQRKTSRLIHLTDWQMDQLHQRLRDNSDDNMLDTIMSYAIDEGLPDIVSYLFIHCKVAIPVQESRSSIRTLRQEQTLQFIDYMKRYSKLTRRDDIFLYLFNEKWLPLFT